jgi:hypothetical protein
MPGGRKQKALFRSVVHATQAGFSLNEHITSKSRPTAYPHIPMIVAGRAVLHSRRASRA